MSDTYFPNDPDRAPIGITVGPRVQDLVTQEAPPEAPANPLEYLYGSPAATAQDPTHANALTKILASAMRDAKNFVVDTATAPYRLVNAAARQDYGKGLDTEIDPEMLTAALSSAGLVMGGGMPMAPKGAVGMSGGRLIQPPKVEAPFYSAVEQAIAAAPQDKMTVPQWKGYLRNQPGVKAEELDWMGLGDRALHPKEWGAKPVSREQLLEHAQGHGVQIKEIEKAGEAETGLHEDDLNDLVLEEVQQYFDSQPTLKALHHDDVDSWLNTHDGQRFYDNAAADLQQQYGDNLENGTKYHEYQLPGGDNYRETLLTLPERRLKDGRAPDRHDPAQQDLGNYYSSHWDEPNVLVHMRMNDRELPDVGKSLHLEEIQSDWHQRGRKQGYKGTDTITSPHGAEEFGAQGKANPVPDAPFKSTWADLALKRAITKAAREGYDAVSWTPGAQQAERYDLSKHIDKLELTHNRDGIGQLKYWTKNGQDLKLINSKNDLVNFVGKDIAEKLYKQGRENNGKASLSGIDLRVGGEGMKAFYDKMLVDKANAIAKKFGAKVEYQEMSNGLEINRNGNGDWNVDHPHDPAVPTHVFKTLEEARADLKKRGSIRVPVLRLTPKLREIAERRGMPLFAKGLPFRFTPVDHDPFNKDDK